LSKNKVQITDIGITDSDSGILTDSILKLALEMGFLSSEEPIIDRQFQPASLDLRLGKHAFILRCSFHPFRGVTELLNDVFENLVIDVIDISKNNGAILYPGNVYLIPLIENINLPAFLYAKSNPRSTTGRLDIFSRVLGETTDNFDYFPPLTKTKLYMEVIPRSFPIRVRKGCSLAQLRLIYKTDKASKKDLELAHNMHGIILNKNGKRIYWRDRFDAGGIYLSINLSGSNNNRIVGYKAKKYTQAIDFWRIGYYKHSDFWEPIYPSSTHSIVLEPEEFCILSSNEKIIVPPNMAAEVAAYDVSVGEIRTHYAGFFDPGFGYSNSGEIGSHIVLEVRARETPFLVVDSQIFFKVHLEKLVGKPGELYGKHIGSSYQYQDLKLAKQFKDE
jgi:dCTP deaminase